MSNLREPAAPAVIAGSFADYRLIKSRSVLQLVIEIPVEAQAGAFDALGYPMPGIEIPVAVARLNPASHRDDGEPGCGTAGLTPKARYAAQLPEQKAVTRAAILCGESEFRTWLAGEDITATQAAEVLRERCGVESRGEFADNPEALARFEKLEADYRFLKRLPEQR